MPRTRPLPPSSIPDRRNVRATSAGEAPSAARTPTSRVFSARRTTRDDTTVPAATATMSVRTMKRRVCCTASASKRSRFRTFQSRTVAPSPRSFRSAATVSADARKLLGEGATVLDWKVLNRDLFEALAVQQTLLFIVLTLIVAVAAGTVVSSLVVLLAEKTREVGVLAALGAPPSLVARTFRLSGLLLGGTGLALGVG